MCKYKLNKRNKLKQRLNAEKFKKNTLKQKLLGFIFYRSPQSNLSQLNKIVINNLKHKGFGLENIPIK